MRALRTSKQTFCLNCTEVGRRTGVQGTRVTCTKYEVSDLPIASCRKKSPICRATECQGTSLPCRSWRLGLKCSFCVPFDTGKQDNRHANSSKPHQEKPTFSLSESASLGHCPRAAVEVQSHIPRYGAMVKAEGFAKRVASVSIYVFNYVAMGETTRLGFLTVWDGAF